MQALWDQERYQLEQQLSSGKFNPSTFLVRDTIDKKKKVIKVINQQRFDSVRASELDRLKDLPANSNILGLFDYSTSKDGLSLLLVMTYCVGEDLKSMMARTTAPLSSDRVVDLIYQILKGLAYLHSQDIVHCNLQPRNLFQSWVYGHIRIGMIGVIRLDQLANEDWSYLSPQQLQNQPYTKKTDIWSLGCIVYEMLTLQKACPGTSLSDIIDQMLSRQKDLRSIPSELLRAILTKCFEIDESTRHDAAQVQEALSSYQQSLAESSANLKPGFALNNGRYIIRRVLTEGEFGQVYLADDQEEQTEKVIKQISTLESARVQKEVNILRSLPRHPTVVAFFDHFMHFSHILVIEYCTAGKLSEVIANKKQANQKIPDKDIFNWSIQILNGLEFFHSKDIVHLDVKPANVFFDQHGVVKLGHHGLARDISSMKSVISLIESCNYMSAEFMQRRPFSKKTDIWSFGCLFFELCSLQKPFNGVTSLGVFQDYTRLNPIYSEFNINSLCIVKKCLQNEPELRPSTNDILAWLNRMTLWTSGESTTLQQFTKNQFIRAAKEPSKQANIIDVYLNVIMSCDPGVGLTNISIPVAQCLRWIGEEYDNQRNYLAAFQYKEKARNMYIVLNQQNSKDMAECLVELSKTCHLRGDHKLELDYLIRSYDIYTSQSFADSDEKAQCLMLLGRAYNWSGDHVSELIFKSRSYEIYQTLHKDSEDDIKLAACLKGLGLAYRFNNEHEKELNCLKKAYDMYKRLCGSNHVEVAKLAKHLGISYSLHKSYRDAQAYKEESVEILEKLSGGSDSLELALSCLELGITLVLRGSGDGGKKKIGLAMIKRLNLPDHKNYADYYLNLSKIFESQNEFEAQLQYNVVALNLYEMLDKQGPDILPFLDSLENAYKNMAAKTRRREHEIRTRRIV